MIYTGVSCHGSEAIQYTSCDLFPFWLLIILETFAKVLVLHGSGNKWSPAFLIDENGGKDEVPCFSPDNNSFIGSCSVLWKNSYYIFGGGNDLYQISKLTGFTLNSRDSQIDNR